MPLAPRINSFRYLRAKIKHLRFAYAAFDERHRYPRMFHWMTAIMGSLQDAFKNKQYASVKRIAILVLFSWHDFLIF